MAAYSAYHAIQQLPIGQVGTILEVYASESLRYRVEFADRQGREHTMAVLQPTEVLALQMAEVKVFYARTGNTLVVWFGNPQDEVESHNPHPLSQMRTDLIYIDRRLMWARIFP